VLRVAQPRRGHQEYDNIAPRPGPDTHIILWSLAKGDLNMVEVVDLAADMDCANASGPNIGRASHGCKKRRHGAHN